MKKVKAVNEFKLIILFSLLLTNCNVVKDKIGVDYNGYDVINSYYGQTGQIELKQNTIDINSYLKSLNQIKFWQEANQDLANNQNEEIKFYDLFNESEFGEIINEFVSANKVKLDQKKVNENIILKKSSQNAISYPYVFEKNNQQYAFIYSENTSGFENGAGGVTFLIKEKGEWKKKFYFRLWIS